MSERLSRQTSRDNLGGLEARRTRSVAERAEEAAAPGEYAALARQCEAVQLARGDLANGWRR